MSKEAIYNKFCDLSFGTKVSPPKEYLLTKKCPRCGATGYLCDNGHQRKKDHFFPCVIWIKDGKLKGRDVLCLQDRDAEAVFLRSEYGCGYDDVRK